ncbi:hypothetical protein BH24DEI2_BH24DEI2_05230 [soil metagenome]
MTTEQRVTEKLRRLPADKQKTVLEFVEFLESRAATPTEEPKSFGALADVYIGAVDGGPGDLSTNKNHLEGYGKR